MKVTVTIDPHFQEEDVAITGPQPSERIQKVQQFIEELDQKERLRARKEGEAFLVEPHLFHRFYIENRQVIGESESDQAPSINSLKSYHPTFYRFHNLRLSIPKKSINCILLPADRSKSI